MKFAPLALAALLPLGSLALSPEAQAGEIRCTLVGTVDSNFYTSGPFAGLSVGDTATLTFVVDTPGTDVAPGQLVNYNIQLGTFDLDINGPTGAMLAGPTACQIQNDFPAADGFRLTQASFTTGHFFTAGFGALGTMFSSVDIEQLGGSYATSMFLTSFDYRIFGQGGQLEIFPDLLIIEPPALGTTFCDPMNPNSTGASTTLTGSPGPAGSSGLHLEATQGPPGEFGYVLVGTAADDPGIMISQGRLCLSTAAGNLVGRYNAPGVLNSIGLFDPSGVMQNQVGTSTVLSGFDVPTTLPLPGSPMIGAGQTWHFQLWHREASGASNFSNGLSVSF